jgi:phosphoglycolate phosphatase
MLEHAQQAATAMYVATSKPAVFAERIVQHFGSIITFGRCTGGARRPTREQSRLVAYLLASEGVRAQAAVMIGDRAADVRAARANGVRSIGVLWGYGSAHELLDAGVDILCEKPSELAAHLSGTQSN